MTIQRVLLRQARVALVVLGLGGCTAFDTPHDYNRHRLSDISLPRGETADGVFFFDVTVTPEFPEKDSAAEASRMEWLADWLEQRHMCAEGYEVLRVRPFSFEEDNPARRDLRYEVRCTTP